MVKWRSQCLCQSGGPGSTCPLNLSFFLFFLFFSFSPSYSCQNTNYHFIGQRKHSKPKLFNNQKQTTLCHLFHTFHSITAIKTPSMYTSINTTNHTELRWSSGYRDTTIVTPTRFNLDCRTILFFLFLQLLVVKIPNIILSDRRNAENQSYLSKKKANKLFHLFPTCHSIRAIKMPSIYTSINMTHQAQLPQSSGDRSVSASLVVRVQLVP